ncbi:putative monooxygenase [Podospora fimiseda]|uniref:Monooxygenase n=1 Tax=Podospora fimiseda TaxID=252190 RepID=A0AAN7BYW8_9PEZI|nr:putative monooxygenase [Podospora fimiseda]
MSDKTKSTDSFGPGRTVAVIGAGISGVCTAAHLLKQGLSVTVFERSGIAGGIWHYDPRIPEDSPYPSNTPSLGDYKLSLRGEYAYSTPPPEFPVGNKLDINTSTLDQTQPTRDKNVPDLEVHFSPPGPCYSGLRNNVPTTLMVSSLHSWPEPAKEFVGQNIVETYIQDLAAKHGVTTSTLFHTRVDEARKITTPDGSSKWEIRSITLEYGNKLTERLSHFDLLVVASGHYNMPRIPDIPGLKEWKTAFPSRVIHSKQYRNPQPYKNQNVVILGAGVSSLDICRELGEISNHTYQSVRGGQYDLPATLLPKNATRVPQISNFSIHPATIPDLTNDDKTPIPGTITLATPDSDTTQSQTLTQIHKVIIATGYITSYPFFSSPNYHSNTLPSSQATPTVLITKEGDMTHNLHKDIFYIPDPTLAFVGVPYHVSTFSLYDFQAQLVARVFSGKAELPPRQKMREKYEAKIKTKGLGRMFHSMHEEGKEIEYVKELVELGNNKGDQNKMVGHGQVWLDRYEKLKEDMKEILAGRGSWEKLLSND